MKTIISLNNGRSKILHGRFGGYEKGRCREDVFPSRRQIIEQELAAVTALEIAECQDSLPELQGLEFHPHDLGLPNLSLVRARLAEGDFRSGITEVLQGALGVSQFRTNRIHFEVPGHNRNSRDKRLVLQLKLDQGGAITAAHYG